MTGGSIYPLCSRGCAARELGVGDRHLRLTIDSDEGRLVAPEICAWAKTLGVLQHLSWHLAAVGVELHDPLVLTQHAELGAVDRAQFLCRDAEHDGSQGVDLDERLAAFGVAAEGGGHGPLWS